jgi:hypothetical protein
MEIRGGMDRRQLREEIAKYPYRTRLGKIFARSIVDAIEPHALNTHGLSELVIYMDDAFAEEGMKQE